MPISRRTLGVLAAAAATLGPLAGAAGAQAQAVTPTDAGAPSAPWNVRLEHGSLSGSILNSSDVSFDAQGGVPGDAVQLFVDDQLVGSQNADPNGNVTNLVPHPLLATGYHTAYLKSLDDANNVSDPSATFSFYVAPPAPTVVSPAGAGTTDDNWAYANSSHPTFTVSGVDPGAKVTLLEGTDAGDPVAVGSVTSEAGGTVSVTATTQVEDGFHMFTVTQSETEGTGPDQQLVASDWMADQTSVDVISAAPTLGSRVSGPTNESKPTFTTGVDGPNINSQVRLINAVTGQTIGQYPLSDYQWTPSSPLPDGRYSVYAVTIDDTGNVGTARSAPVDFTLSTVAPAAPKVISPADGATISAGDFAITTGGNAAGDYICPVLDAGTSNEDVSLCGQPADANGHATFTLNGGLSAGSHTLTVWASDQYGNYSQTVTTFTVRAGTSSHTAPPTTSPTPPTTNPTPTPQPKAPTVTTPVLPGGGLTVHPGGHTQLNLQVSAPGTVTVIIERHQGGKWVPSGTQTLRVKHAGQVPLAVGTSFAGHQLAPGSYRLAIQASSNGQRSRVLKVALTVVPHANRPHGQSRLLSLAVNPHSITWRRGLRAPKLWLTFRSSRDATLAMTLQARIDGHWQQVSDTSAHVLAGSDRLQLIGRWHGQMVPPRDVRLTVRATASGMNAVTRTFSITVRHGQPVIVR